MASIKTVGVDEYLNQLNTMLDNSAEIAGKMVYKGAGIVADEIKKRISQIPERDEHGEGRQRGVTDAERAGLSESLGISRLRNDEGFFNEKIGFDGYNSYVTKKYPKGHPNSMVARTIESGTSWLQKTPFIAPAVSASRDRAEKEMEKIFDDSIKKANRR